MSFTSSCKVLFFSHFSILDVRFLTCSCDILEHAGRSASGVAAGGMGISFEEHASENSRLAVLTTAVEFLNCTAATMCSFVPDDSLQSSGRETIDKGAVFARAMHAQGFEALEKNAHGRDLPERYPQYKGSLSSLSLWVQVSELCAVRPPFKSLQFCSTPAPQLQCLMVHKTGTFALSSRSSRRNICSSAARSFVKLSGEMSKIQYRATNWPL